MRDYSKFSPKFWTGDTGKRLRDLGRDAQVIGSYLFTCPTANMIGLYYLNLATLIDEVGHIDREGALKVLRSLSEGGYATFDEASQTVFVVEMARHQIGETLSRRDNRHKAVLKELEHYRKSPFFNAFLERYIEAFQLHELAPNAEKPKGLRRAFQAPSKPGTGAGTGAGTGEGSGEGTGTGTEAGAGRKSQAQELNGHVTGTDPGPGPLLGENVGNPPEEPSSRRGPAAERRNGDFEAINDAVCKVLTAGGVKPGNYREIARMAGISTLQAEIAVRQLRDRGRLPQGAAA